MLARSIGGLFLQMLARAVKSRKHRSVKRADQNIVGEEFHPPFRVNDFAPYITKIMASGAEILMTANFGPDLVCSCGKAINSAGRSRSSDFTSMTRH